MFVSVHCESLQDVSTLMPRLILCQTRPLSFFGVFGFITIAQYDEAAKSQGHQLNISRFTLNLNFPWHLLGEPVLHTVMGFMLTKLDLETKWTFLLPEGKQFALIFFFYQSKIKVNKMPHPSHRFLFISPFFTYVISIISEQHKMTSSTIQLYKLLTSLESRLLHRKIQFLMTVS